VGAFTPAAHAAYAELVSQYCSLPSGDVPMGIKRLDVCCASEDAEGPESAAQDVAASAAMAFMMDWELSASAVLAEVMMRTSPTAFAVATAVLLELPDEEVEVLVVPLSALAAADAALPDENDVVTTRASCPSASAVALVMLFPPSSEVDWDVVVMLRGADGLMEVNCVLYALPSA
jgi:hypothetical protein